MIDLAGHIFYLFLFAGMMLIGRKKQLGWVLRFIGEIGWVCIGIKLGLTSVWVWGILFCLIDVVSFIRWRNKE